MISLLLYDTTVGIENSRNASRTGGKSKKQETKDKYRHHYISEKVMRKECTTKYNKSKTIHLPDITPIAELLRPENGKVSGERPH